MNFVGFGRAAMNDLTLFESMASSRSVAPSHDSFLVGHDCWPTVFTYLVHGGFRLGSSNVEFASSVEGQGQPDVLGRRDFEFHFTVFMARGCGKSYNSTRAVSTQRASCARAKSMRII